MGWRSMFGLSRTLSGTWTPVDGKARAVLSAKYLRTSTTELARNRIPDRHPPVKDAKESPCPPGAA